MVKDKIIQAVQKAVGEKDLHLEVPEREEFGDYAFFSQEAAQVAEKLKQDKDLAKIVDRFEVINSFVNLWLAKSILASVQNKVAPIGRGQTVVIDYSSPNIAKPFGIGHLRSTIIGQALYNLYQFLGYKVIGDNHLGDWGTQFGKLLYMLKLKALTTFDIDKLEELYVEFHQKAEKKPEMEEEARRWFKKLEDGDKEARELWQQCVEVSLKEFERIYKLLGVKIDYAYGESFYQSYLPEVVSWGEKSQGAMVINLPGFKTPLMLQKSDGATTYAARDLATIKFRVEKWDPEIIIYEIGGEQTFYFQQIFAAARRLGLVDKDVVLYHTKHGLYLSPGGKKFSTRKGETVKLEAVLKEAIARAKKLGCEDEKTAQAVGVGAIKYFDLMHSVSSDIVFDWEKVMNLEGNSGPYLQYTVARTNSVLAKAGLIRPRLTVLQGEALRNPEELSVLRALIHFPEVVEEAALSYAPNLLCNYLFSLAKKFNLFYQKHRIIDSKEAVLRLQITKTTNQVLKTGLSLLGIATPERL